MAFIDPRYNIPSKSSEPSQWIQWHTELKKTFGKKKANSIFVFAWSKRGNTKIVNTELLHYLQGEGIQIEAGLIVKIDEKLYDVFDEISDIFTLAKYSSLAVGGIIILGLAMMVYNIAKDPIKAATTAASIKSGGIK